MNMNTIRDILNQSYINIRPDISQALISAINAAEESGEDIYSHLLSLVTGISENRVGAINAYLQDTNRNSVTRQFFQDFIQPENALVIAARHGQDIRLPQIQPVNGLPLRRNDPQALEEDIYYFYE